ncbi:hypothetical protein AB0F77_38040 [Streptomyces sp. NPDC026672]|uniref:hypothetical protein n=1 Tax=unclassified Streptomyces TaxID=2593676 RepID=UPI0034097FEB
MTGTVHDVPLYLWVFVLAAMAGAVGLTGFVLYRGARLSGRGRRRAAGLGAACAVLLGGWFTTSGVVAANGGYLNQPGRPPVLPIAFAAALTVMPAATQVPVVARALAAPGMLSRLELPHTLRVVGAAFLIMMALGHLPALFAVPAGLGDIATGIAAPFVARRVAKGTGRRTAVWFNVLGMTDLVTALTLAVLIGNQVIDVTPSTQAITQLPLALIPTAAVPLLFTLHITSLRRLAAGRAHDQHDKGEPCRSGTSITRPTPTPRSRNKDWPPTSPPTTASSDFPSSTS